MSALLVGALLASVVFAFSVTVIHAWKELHHFYYGAALVVATIAGAPVWVGIVGLVVMIDDATQHLVQIVRPQFRSPLHLAYRATIYRWITR